MFQSAYVFGPWTFPSDRPDFAYRTAPREDDRAEVWLHVPDDGSAPYYAGCFGGMGTSIEFRDGTVRTLEDACRALDARIGAAGHYLYEQVQATAQHWQDVSGVAREVIAHHRGGPDLMADDDLVDVIARALKDFPGLLQQRDRLQAVLDAETGRKGLPGWKWNNIGKDWRLPGGEDWLAIVQPVAVTGVSYVVERDYTQMKPEPGYVSSCPGQSALEDMEHAEARLRELGRLPAKD